MLPWRAGKELGSWVATPQTLQEELSKVAKLQGIHPKLFEAFIAPSRDRDAKPAPGFPPSRGLALGEVCLGLQVAQHLPKGSASCCCCCRSGLLQLQHPSCPENCQKFGGRLSGQVGFSLTSHLSNLAAAERPPL